MNDISLRIKELIDIKKMNISSFEKKIGAGNNSIGTIINRNSNVSGAILSKILNTFEDVSGDYLLTGKGKLLRNSEENKTDNPMAVELLEYKNKEIAELKQQLQDCQEEKKIRTDSKINV